MMHNKVYSNRTGGSAGLLAVLTGAVFAYSTLETLLPPALPEIQQALHTSISSFLIGAAADVAALFVALALPARLSAGNTSGKHPGHPVMNLPEA